MRLLLSILIFTLFISCSTKNKELDVRLADSIIHNISTKLDSFYIDQEKGIKIGKDLQNWYKII